MLTSTHKCAHTVHAHAHVRARAEGRRGGRAGGRTGRDGRTYGLVRIPIILFIYGVSGTGGHFVNTLETINL